MPAAPSRFDTLSVVPADEALLRPVVSMTVNQAVYQAMCQRLMLGVYQAGQVLGIQEIADDLQTSTMPVREALRSLMAQKALEPMRSRSVRVPLITSVRLHDLKQVRVLIEGQAMEWAVPFLNEEKVHTLEKMAQDIQNSRTDLTSSLELNRQFHFLIYGASQSTVATGVIESLWLQSGPYLRAVRELCGLGREKVDEHHYAIVQAIRQRDGKAARQAMELDVAWAFEELQKLQHGVVGR